MKKFLPVFLFAFMMFAVYGSVNAQCNPDTSVGLGIHPEIPDTGCVGSAYSDTVTFVFPEDTLFNGLNVPFDSFVVGTIIGIPPGLSYECDQINNNCTYVTTPGSLTRGCVAIFGTPTTANLATDSVGVVGAAWITVFGFPVEIEDTIRISLRVFDATDAYCTGTYRDELATNSVDLGIYPNPLTANSVVSFRLKQAEEVNVVMQDMYGRTVRNLADGALAAGKHELALDHAGLQNGIYFVRMRIGETVLSRKVVISQ